MIRVGTGTGAGPPVLVMAHGWGFDAGSLRALAAALGARGVRTLLAEEGLLGAEPDWPVPDAPFAVLGHSAGFPRVLRRFGEECIAAVALNGFTRFAAGAGFAHGVPARVIARMRARLPVHPVAVVDAFRAAHGAPPLPAGAPVDAGRLGDGLRRLAGEDDPAAVDAATVLERLRRRGAPVLAVCAPDDALVTPAHARACFPEHEIRWERGGHLLPLAAPDRCAALVAGFLRPGGGDAVPVLPPDGASG